MSRLPAAWRRGARIGVFSPSRRAAGPYPERYARGVHGVERFFGGQVVVAAEFELAHGFVAGTGALRAADFLELFRDDSVAAVLTT